MGLFSRSALTMQYEMMGLGVPEKIACMLAAAAKGDVSSLPQNCARAAQTISKGTNYVLVEEGIRKLRAIGESEFRMDYVEGMCWAVFGGAAAEIFAHEYAAQEMPIGAACPDPDSIVVAANRGLLARQGQRYWRIPNGDPMAAECQVQLRGGGFLDGFLVMDHEYVGFFDVPSIVAEDMESPGTYRWFTPIDCVTDLKLVADRSLKLGGLKQTEVAIASRDTVLTVMFYDDESEEHRSQDFRVLRENFYSAMGLYNRSAFVEFVRKLDDGIAEWKDDYYGEDQT